jgi:hypothetical protein
MEQHILASTAITLVVLGIVLVAILTRAATEYSPESPIRLWVTRLAVAATVMWLARGLFYQINARSSFFDLVLSRSFARAVIGILLVLLVFGNEL